MPNGTCGKRFNHWLEVYDKLIDHKYIYGVRGYNLKPADLQGSIGLEQIKKFDEIHKRRKANKDRLSNIFDSISGVRVIQELPEAETSWFGVPIVCRDELNSIDKHSLVKHLDDNGIQTRNYFAGNILMHPAYKEIGNHHEYPNASKVLDEVLFIGCSPVITAGMISYIEEVVNNFKDSGSDYI